MLSLLGGGLRRDLLRNHPSSAKLDNRQKKSDRASLEANAAGQSTAQQWLPEAIYWIRKQPGILRQPVSANQQLPTASGWFAAPAPPQPRLAEPQSTLAINDLLAVTPLPYNSTALRRPLPQSTCQLNAPPLSIPANHDTSDAVPSGCEGNALWPPRRSSPPRYPTPNLPPRGDGRQESHRAALPLIGLPVPYRGRGPRDGVWTGS